MKSQNLLLLGLMWSSAVNAADVLPTEFKAFDIDLARPELKLNNPFAYRLGINFVEGHNYVLHPIAKNVEDSSSIRREFNASILLPFSIETGLSLYDSQQASSDSPHAIDGDGDHKSQHLGGAIYGRLRLTQSENLNTSILVQYEPGTADRSSFHQASQDKSGIAFHIDGSPFAYTQAGFFIGATRRKDEKFRTSRLNDEILYGTRVSVGSPALQIFTESQMRSMPWKSANSAKSMPTSLSHEIGFSGNYQDVSAQASLLIPTGSRNVGVPERSFQIALQMMLGKASSKAAASVPPAESDDGASIKALPSSPKPLAPPAETESGAVFENLKTGGQDEGLGEIPIFQDEIEKTKNGDRPAAVINAPGSDEFEKWDEQVSSENKRSETATEKAEREYRAQLAHEKKVEKVKSEQAMSTQEAERLRLINEMDKDERETRKSAKQIEDELNEFTLPDRDEVNWNGLTK